MKPKATIYYNPQCSKCRQTLALLRARGIEPEIVEYLKKPLAPAEISRLMDLLGGKAHDILRIKKAAYGEKSLSESSTKDEIVRAIVENPILMERPIVVVGEKAVIARPPEKSLPLLQA